MPEVKFLILECARIVFVFDKTGKMSANFETWKHIKGDYKIYNRTRRLIIIK